ncbi:MAG: hypothetical protein MPJ22_00250, partial [Pirellulales bacterium]|nr:hypothetical protein [Pirellulales bacterium]
RPCRNAILLQIFADGLGIEVVFQVVTAGQPPVEAVSDQLVFPMAGHKVPRQELGDVGRPVAEAGITERTGQHGGPGRAARI